MPKHARVSKSVGDIYWLEEDYTNHAGDEFRKGEALGHVTNKQQLARLGASIGDPAIAFYEVVLKGTKES